MRFHQSFTNTMENGYLQSMKTEIFENDFECGAF